jgi:hypothetical protein
MIHRHDEITTRSSCSHIPVDQSRRAFTSGTSMCRQKRPHLRPMTHSISSHWPQVLSKQATSGGCQPARPRQIPIRATLRDQESKPPLDGETSTGVAIFRCFYGNFHLSFPVRWCSASEAHHPRDLSVPQDAGLSFCRPNFYVSLSSSHILLRQLVAVFFTNNPKRPTFLPPCSSSIESSPGLVL